MITIIVTTVVVILALAALIAGSVAIVEITEMLVNRAAAKIADEPFDRAVAQAIAITKDK